MKTTCATLFGFYVFNGENCTSTFKETRKVGSLKNVGEKSQVSHCLSTTCDDWNVKLQVLKQLEQFTCLMNKQGRESSVGVVGAMLLRKMAGKDKTHFKIFGRRDSPSSMLLCSEVA